MHTDGILVVDDPVIYFDSWFGYIEWLFGSLADVL